MLYSRLSFINVFKNKDMSACFEILFASRMRKREDRQKVGYSYFYPESLVSLNFLSILRRAVRPFVVLKPLRQNSVKLKRIAYAHTEHTYMSILLYLLFQVA